MVKKMEEKKKSSYACGFVVIWSQMTKTNRFYSCLALKSVAICSQKYPKISEAGQNPP